MDASEVVALLREVPPTTTVMVPAGGSVQEVRLSDWDPDGDVIELLPAAEFLQQDKPLKYIDVVPSLPGWYWERRLSGVRIIELPHCGTWPRSWQERKVSSIEGSEGETRQRLEALPDTHWRVEYAGPIQPPGN